MHAIACQGIQEHRKSGHKGFTFTRGHLGNLTFMKHDAAKELHVVVHHVPLGIVAAGYPVVVVNGLVAFYVNKVVCGGQFTVEIGGSDLHGLVLGKAAGGALHDGEGFGHNLVEFFLEAFQHFLLQFVDAVEHIFTVLDGQGFNLFFQLVDFLTQVVCRVLYLMLQFLGLGTQGVVVQLVYGLIGFLYGFDIRLYFFHVACRFVSEQFA